MVGPGINPLRAQFDALLANYRRELPAKISSLEALWSAGRLADLRRELHTLAGSAGTFGLPQIGAAALAAGGSLVENSDALQRDEFARRLARLKELGTELASE